jgi:hypothetical protein
MPFAAVAGGVASAVVGAGLGALQKGSVSSGQSQASGALAAQQAELAPYTTTGTNALGVASDLAGANGPDAATKAMANFYTDPGYQFQLGEGLRAVDAGAAAKGLLRSGATLKDEMRFGQGLAASDFDKYYNRLFDLSKLGETAAVGGSSLAETQAKVDANAAGANSSIYGNIGQGAQSAITGLANNPKVQSWVNGLFSPSAGDVGSSGYTTAPGMASSGYTLAPGF